MANEPEFYDTLTNNCTTNIVHHVNRIRPNRIVPDSACCCRDYSDQLAYDQGLIERHGTFAATKAAGVRQSARAAVCAGREDFSELIRREISGQPRRAVNRRPSDSHHSPMIFTSTRFLRRPSNSP